MPVNLQAPNPLDLAPVAGVTLGIAEAGVRKANRKDLVVVRLEEGAAVAGVFTQNRFCAAPVQVCREHLAAGSAVRANVINCPPDPEHVKVGMKVRLATYSIGTDDDGTEAIGFGFEPIS